VDGCRCAICTEANRERQFFYRLDARLARIEKELGLDPWEVDLEREALISQRERRVMKGSR
jgi:hypothetical protein